jgi:cytochrome c oxidase subunit II
MDTTYGFHLPPDISTHGPLVDQLIYVIHVFMVVLFVGWLIFFMYTLFRFRARDGHRANYAPKYSRFSTYLEVGIAVFEAALLVVFAIPAWKLAKASIPSAKDRFEVKVIAEQFAWNIHYPGADGKFGKSDPSLMSAENPVGLDKNDPASKDDLTAINTMNLPVDRQILVYLTSKDVIHSFGVPVLRVKQDAVPGMSFPVYFQAKKTGEYEIACSQLCGLGHYRMRGQITFQTDEEFKKWFEEQRADSAEAAAEE